MRTHTAWRAVPLALMSQPICSAIKTPQIETFEVDLIFPPNGSKFSAVGVPPLVFAVQNPDLAISLGAGMRWNLYDEDSFQHKPFMSLQAHAYDLQHFGTLDNTPYIWGGALDRVRGREGKWTISWVVGVLNSTRSDPSVSEWINEDRFTTFMTGDQYPPLDLELFASSLGDDCPSQTIVTFEAEVFDNRTEPIQYPSVATKPNPCAVSFNVTRASSMAAEITSAFCRDALVNRTGIDCDSGKDTGTYRSEAFIMAMSMQLATLLTFLLGAALLL